ncbi:MAG: mannonate dehydratase [Bosea sp. (in: a-proteobacteria)]|uniref:mannonate dehydratase n=1 Tax=Bosea sp. (in: a-proteobacteria) TaxID=1871050 RepID=UPI00273660AD|nr:mannonate dehydratase [Bosea sp. (in: a-proteobacteria)]MDP3254845.1 mannonate dehydratase [Bosea sp. (in: a-proteobacteria)]MDP3320081.1 mannonate dehydratase [Bosea sp. (in: a-proteobacteria)]
MKQTWRWFGPDDAVTLAAARQAGASGIVTALHHIPYGEVWSIAEIEKRKAEIAEPGFGLDWSVVESLPIHERVKLGEGDLEPIFANYRQSMANLAACGLKTICYNFMPVLDWTRTELDHPLPAGARALRFNAHEYLAFDWLILERPGAQEGQSPELRDKARAWFDASTQADRDRLLANIMAGLPGAYDRYDVPALRGMLARYAGIDADGLRANFARFLRAVVPTAQDLGMRLCVHPDDPPRPLFGLPRIVSTEADIEAVLGMVDLPANGLTLCSGSLGAHPENDVPAIARRFADRIWFAHLRNVAKDPDGSFMEAEHLGGDTDMVALIAALLDEEARRRAEGRADWEIPMRPDHGHEILDDIGRGSFPGYPAIGRLRGLAELRGVMTALAHRPAASRQG